MRKIPQKRHAIRVNEILSVRPDKAMPVVVIKITGPTNANSELI